MNKPDFKLSCTIQTYLNSICRNQILVRLKHTSKYEIKDAEANNDYIENISDWFESVEEVNEERVSVMAKIFKEMKESSNKCYDILMRFFYLNQTMDKIAVDLNYTNADNAKNQKYRCQEKFKTEVFKRLQK